MVQIKNFQLRGLGYLLEQIYLKQNATRRLLLSVESIATFQKWDTHLTQIITKAICQAVPKLCKYLFNRPYA